MHANPFLKWAGGKRRLLDKILPELPAGKRFVEPFAGSAAVYLNAPFESALVCDLNPDLISLFTIIQQQGDDFIGHCRDLFIPENNTSEKYYQFREEFNTAADDRRKASLFVYLNRHSYNGLVRYNASGQFNVPFGRYLSPRFPEAEMRLFHEKTQAVRTEFSAIDFQAAFDRILPGDVVYCDPPYAPLSRTSNFTTYCGNTFTEHDQRRLAELALAAASKGAKVILSNHNTELTRSLYASATIKTFSVRRNISCNKHKRLQSPEILVICG